MNSTLHPVARQDAPTSARPDHPGAGHPNAEPVIGIIGGMGPEATVELMRRIIQRTAAADDADHIRMLVDNNPMVPSRIAYLLEGGEVDPGPVLAAMALGLQSLGATHLAMPCNTAHHFAAAIRAAVDIPLIDMLKVSFATCARRYGEGARIGVLGSPALRQVGVLDRHAARHDLELAYLDDDLAGVALKCIRQVKAGQVTTGRGAAELQAEYASLKDDLRARRTAALLICCTEFSVLQAQCAPNSADCVDTLDELAGAIAALKAR